MAHDQLIADYLAPMSPLPTSITPGGGLVEKIQCVLFDIYGTLFISGSGDISAAGKASPLSQKLEHLVHKYGVGKTPQALVGELHDAGYTHKLISQNINYVYIITISQV